MNPQTFTITRKRGATIRWAVVRALVITLSTAIRLSLRLLTRDHPARVFLESRIRESIPPVEQSLNTCDRTTKAVEGVAGASIILFVWHLIDLMVPMAEIGPLDCTTTLLTSF